MTFEWTEVDTLTCAPVLWLMCIANNNYNDNPPPPPCTRTC